MCLFFFFFFVLSTVSKLVIYDVGVAILFIVEVDLNQPKIEEGLLEPIQ